MGSMEHRVASRLQGSKQGEARRGGRLWCCVVVGSTASVAWRRARPGAGHGGRLRAEHGEDTASRWLSCTARTGPWTPDGVAVLLLLGVVDV